MNRPSKWRTQLAQKVGSIYATNPNVAAVLIGGSTARGHADRFSDIELGVFWHTPPALTDRARAVEALQADLLRLYPYHAQHRVWADDFMIGRTASNQPKSGVLVEVAHHTVEFMEQVLEDVLQNHQPDELKQNLIAGVLQGISLTGVRQLKQWKERAGQYPPELGANIIRQKGQIDHYWRWQMWIERGQNLLMLHRQWSEVQQRVLHVLLALNQEYYFGFKWLDVVLAKLKTAPLDFSDRLKSLSKLPPEQGAAVLAQLVEDTYDLVEQHVPGVDVNRLRRIFRWQRPRWEEPPPLVEM